MTMENRSSRQFLEKDSSRNCHQGFIEDKIIEGLSAYLPGVINTPSPARYSRCSFPLSSVVRRKATKRVQARCWCTSSRMHVDHRHDSSQKLHEIAGCSRVESDADSLKMFILRLAGQSGTRSFL